MRRRRRRKNPDAGRAIGYAVIGGTVGVAIAWALGKLPLFGTESGRNGALVAGGLVGSASGALLGR